ncbi:FAR1-related sequence 5-like protein [Tanacetum coccineum]
MEGRFYHVPSGRKAGTIACTGQGPLLTIDLANTPYWTDNWSQLCPTCKVKEEILTKKAIGQMGKLYTTRAITIHAPVPWFLRKIVGQDIYISDMIVLILARVINHVPDKVNFQISRSECPSNEGHAKSRTINILKNISLEEGMLYTTRANTIHTLVPWFLCKIVGQDICHCVELTIVDAKTRSMQLEHQSTEIRVDYSKHPVPYLPEDEKKPEIGDIFDTFDVGYDMYKAYAEKGRFNVRKSGQKTYKGKVTHKYVLCNRAGKVRDKFDKNALKECDNENEKKDGKRKRKRKTKSSVTNCPAKIGLKAIRGTGSWKIFDFVENHNHLLLNENNMDLSRVRRQLHFGDYIFIHRASLSNIGPTIAHRLKVALIGGYDKVRGTPWDYRNFKRDVNLFIGDRDAQMIVDKMINRQLHVSKFSFEYHVFHDELVSMFWADETMKCNYAVFGDVVSLDATFRTNKYDFVFVPFTGIDRNQKCVTFGAALLSDETEESYIWMLEAFLKVHQKQPPLALTDQDAALRNAVVKIFPESKHRLCMWHITQKLTGKVLGDLEADSDFRKEYGPCIEETNRLAAEVHATIEDCVGLIRNDTDKLNKFLTTVKALKKQLEDEMPKPDYAHNKEALFSNLLGVTVPCANVLAKSDEDTACDEDTASDEHNANDEVESDDD